MLDNVLNAISGNVKAVINDLSSYTGQKKDESAETPVETTNLSSLSDRNKVENLLNTAIDDVKKGTTPNFSADDVKKMTDKLNTDMNDMNLQLKFVWYKELDQLGVKMIDINTQKTIKSFPPEDVMKTLMKTKEWVGKFLDENA
ncbi:flagellar protein FlaG [Pectinatus cerevisiiphilus]|uniref:Putative FlaG/YvyC family protein n=1 Tax=Pectinatus cerevisiiphilus TaxID=86956 RepID=A0A4R3K9J3_9FIRM|nr:flagellar protein FlaG [Pectinatus cerevisiiphilus]TCS79637.1 putative FlaG/YvyC family protein [Pectinatus cerevisiiphilus]